MKSSACFVITRQWNKSLTIRLNPTMLLGGGGWGGEYVASMERKDAIDQLGRREYPKIRVKKTRTC